MHKRLHKLTAALSASAIAFGVLAAMPFSVSAENKQLLILGDSISTGYGLLEHQDNYGDILGDALGYEVTNLAVSGATTSDLLSLLETDSAKQAVKNADLICISIGGNDAMQPAKTYLEQKLGLSVSDSMSDIVKAISALSDNEISSLIARLTGAIRTPIKNAAANLGAIESAIRELNSDTTLVMQTVYNPLEYYKTSYQGSDFSDKYDMLQNYINSNLANLNKPLVDASAKLETVTAVDINSSFKGSGWLYVNSDNKDVHPTPAGHALIACEILEALNQDVKTMKIAPALAAMKKSYFLTIPDDDYALFHKYMKNDIGDVNGDCAVDSIDATFVLLETASAMLGKEYLTAEQKVMADVNHDGQVNDVDATKILLYFAKQMISDNPDWKNLIG